MDSNRPDNWIQITTGLAIVLGLVLVFWELQQGREATKSQLTHDTCDYYAQITATRMGDEITPIVAKACERPDELTVTELMVYDA